MDAQAAMAPILPGLSQEWLIALFAVLFSAIGGLTLWIWSGRDMARKDAVEVCDQLSERMDPQFEQLREDLRGIRDATQHVDSQVGEMRRQMEKGLSELEIRLNTKISDLRERMDKNLADQENRLKEQIIESRREVGRRMQEQCVAPQERLEVRVNGHGELLAVLAHMNGLFKPTLGAGD